MTETTDGTTGGRVRIPPEQWKRIEDAAAGTLMQVQLAVEAVERREWPRTEATSIPSNEGRVREQKRNGNGDRRTRGRKSLRRHCPIRRVCCR